MCHFDEPERGEILKKHETTVTLKDFSVVSLLRNDMKNKGLPIYDSPFLYKEVCPSLPRIRLASLAAGRAWQDHC